MTTQDRVAIILSLVVAMMSVPLLVAQGRAFLKGYKLREQSFQYSRLLAFINMYNSLVGASMQTRVYEWQWRTLGYIEIGMAGLCLAWVPLGLVILLGR